VPYQNTEIDEDHGRREKMDYPRFDVVIIGGGPVGGLTSAIVAKAGYSTLLLEEHETIGEPIQCAGLITPRVFEMVDCAESSIINKVRGAHIYSPHGRRLTVEAGETRAVVIDRKEFDTAIVNHARNIGVEVWSGAKATGISHDGNDWEVSVEEKTKESIVGCQLLIGADGASSRVRHWLDLPQPDLILNGFDATVNNLEIDKEYVNIFTGKNVAPNFFAWMIPTGENVRVGLCTRDTQEPVYQYFKRLFTDGVPKDLLQGACIMDEHSGRIPLGLLKKTYSDGSLLVGDAAAQVKATSGGGIYMGLVCARHCARTIIDALEKDDISEKSLANYQKQWMDEVGDELKHDLMIHRIYTSMTDRQIEEAFDLLDNEEILGMVNSIGDIDYPSRLGWALLKKEPRFLKFAGKFLKYRLGGK
jgi:geranylgeranyl reductase family protein